MRAGSLVAAISILLLASTTACRKSAPIEVYDGFESPTLSPPAHYNPLRKAPFCRM